MAIEPTQPPPGDTETVSTAHIADFFESDVRKLAQVVEEQHPQQIAGFRILRKIGGGGMGVVYEAMEDRLERRVALKLIKPGYMTADMLRRFEYEARLLARLEHPGIARIHFAGIWDAGAGPQPYFAMEFVEGQTLDEYLQQNRAKLRLRQLIELFHQICEAVQAAHAKGIVHRDLKPDNILIISRGGGGEPVEPKPKILDFGIARAIDADTTSATQRTESGAIVGTVPYMAPEQIRGQVDEIEQATDVYALGVIGYELLADRMPYPVKGRPLPEAARIICEDEPSRLSSINKSLRGDVETIVQKALEKEKTRRYTSAGELAADVKRYLDYEPITARPPSTWYNIRKFAKRNRLLVTGVGLIFAVLAAGILVSSFFAIRAERQKREAQAQSDTAKAARQFVGRMLYAANPESARGKPILVTDVLEQAAKDVGKEFADRPIVEAEVRMTIATTYGELNQNDKALPQAQAAFRIREAALGQEHADTLWAEATVATLLAEQGDYQSAEPLIRHVLEARRRLLGDKHLDTIGITGDLAELLRRQGKLSEAESLARDIVASGNVLLPEDNPKLLGWKRMLGNIVLDSGRPEEALRIAQTSLQIVVEKRGEDSPESIEAMKAAASALSAAGKSLEALELRRRALKACETVFGAENIATTKERLNVGATLSELGRDEEAKIFLKSARDAFRRLLSADHPYHVNAVLNLAAAESRLGNTEEAVASVQPLYQDLTQQQSANKLVRFQVGVTFGAILQNSGRLEQADALYDELIPQAEAVLGGEHPVVLLAINNRGYGLLRAGNSERAMSMFEVALQRQRQTLGSDHPDTLGSMNNFAQCLMALHRSAEAEPLFRTVLAARQRAVGADDPETLRSMNNLIKCLLDIGRDSESIPLLQELMERRQRVLGERDPATLGTKLTLCATFMSLRRYDEACPLAESLYAAPSAVEVDAKQAAWFVSRYGPCLVSLGRHADAAGPLRVAYERLKETGQEKHPQFKVVLESLVEVADVMNRPDDAARWRAELAALEATTKPSTMAATVPATHPAAR